MAIALVGLPLRAAVTAAFNAADVNAGHLPNAIPDAIGEQSCGVVSVEDASQGDPRQRELPEHMPKMSLWQWLEMKLFRGIF